MSQYAGVVFPARILHVAAVGPYRSRERAEAANERLTVALDSHDIVDAYTLRRPEGN